MPPSPRIRKVSAPLPAPIVPLALARSYVAAHPAASLVEVDGGHFAVIDPRSTAWPELLAALSAA